MERDPRGQKVVAYDLIIIGEATNKVSRRSLEADPRIPRNDLVHPSDLLDLAKSPRFHPDTAPWLDSRWRKAKTAG